jgi:Domain of unknown function (DUF1905)/Bacteriocin-protection, YdeI or OmpD-Associated
MAGSFTAKIYIIGVNPYVLLPKDILLGIFKEANKDKGPIPVKGTINGHKFIQTLVKYSGKWRLYLNTPMRKATKLSVGDIATFQLEFDSEERKIPMHPKLSEAFSKYNNAKTCFDTLPPYRQKEIVRYMSFLKSEESVERNIEKVIEMLVSM